MIGNRRKLSGREKLDAMDQQRELFQASNWRCVVCGTALNLGTPQLGHRLGQGDRMMRKYGPEIVHHPLAMVPVERLSPCNSACLVGDETGPGRALVARIRRILAGEETMPDMREYYAELREEFRERRER